MADFVRLRKDEEKKGEKKKLSQFLKSHISGMVEAIRSIWYVEY